MPKIAGEQREVEEARKGLSLPISERAQLCRHPDFTLLASRTVRQEIPVELRPQSVLFYYSGFRKRTHEQPASVQ